MVDEYARFNRANCFKYRFKLWGYFTLTFYDVSDYGISYNFYDFTFIRMDLSKRKIKLDVVGNNSSETSTDIQQPSYRILVPVANPKSQKGLLQLALAIAGNHSAVVNPLSLIELDEDYLFESTPEEANRIIRQRKKQINDIIETLEPANLKGIVNPIIQIANDVSRRTAKIAISKQADLILVGWHRPAFSDNRLGGRVGKILNSSPIDVAVFVDKHPQDLRSILVAYAENMHDDLSLSLALRLLVNNTQRKLTILRFSRTPSEKYESSNEFRKIMEILPTDIHTQIETIRIKDKEPIKAVIEASKIVDLTIAGTSRTWGIERQTLGFYTDQLAQDCHSSLLITRRYSPVSNHLQSLVQLS